MNYEGYLEAQIFPKIDDYKGEVYILLFNDGTTTREFYVGQTSRFLGRMDDYFWAEPAAATDFKVGIAIRYFCQKLNGSVLVKHKLVDDRLAEEKKVLAMLKGQPLLNGGGLGYDYKTANIDKVRERIHQKCDEIAAFPGKSNE